MCYVVELIYTERAHVRNLKVMQLLFLQPMREEAWIPKDFTELLFPKIEQLIEAHCKSIII